MDNHNQEKRKNNKAKREKNVKNMIIKNEKYAKQNKQTKFK